MVPQRKREEQGAEGLGSLRVQARCSSEPNKAGGVWSSAVNGDGEGDEAGGKAGVCVGGGSRLPKGFKWKRGVARFAVSTPCSAGLAGDTVPFRARDGEQHRGEETAQIRGMFQCQQCDHPYPGWPWRVPVCLLSCH